MRKKYSVIIMMIALFGGQTALAQEVVPETPSVPQDRLDTLYYNKSWKVTPNKAFANYYRLALYPADSTAAKEFRTYYMSGELQGEGSFVVLDKKDDAKSQFAGPEIKGKTLGIIGLGAIGALVANAAVALGMKVVGTDPFLSVGAALRLDPSVTVVKTQDDVFAVADYLTIHVPFNKDTEGMINAASIAKMKDGVRVLNYARGELVNDEDMLAALESGKVAYYCTDFPNAKTCNAKHIIATPHLGASTPESEDNCASMAADELMAYLEQGDICNSVNLPNAQLQAVYTKVCVIHRNVPAMISALTSVIGAAGANIENMTNASKKDYAYTILDIDGVTDDMIAALQAIDGVLRVRVIEK